MDRSTAPLLGVYKGYGAEAVAAVERHEELLGRPVGIGNDYLPHGSWSDFDPATMCGYQLDPWRKWRDARPGAAFVYGIPPLVDGFEGAFARGTAGEFDAAYARAARALVESGHGDAIVRLGWEPNNRAIGPWQATDDPGGYAALFRHVVAVFRATPGACFTFELSSSLGVRPGHRLGAFADYYPGDAYVDWLGMNAYDLKWGDPGASAADRWSWIRSQAMGLDAHTAFVRARGKRNVCSEWGLYRAGDAFAGGGDNTFFVERMAEYFSWGEVAYQSYFDHDWGGGTLTDFPAGRATYRRRFG
ncbi:MULTISPECIES: hypothetical protein [Streptomyces]|uniref:GH26 domain-containing protein n=1 Tax=Streptomyces solicathayae TaxID=3081768 RepID=A0ABZ0LL17_9ACTN|nr:hypothetical protein [Streptomyces sp. HUAS YS2]WOX20193.1 hypothetical protein R2D22_01825 [Streptomyces sp. HUAS YS2]